MHNFCASSSVLQYFFFKLATILFLDLKKRFMHASGSKRGCDAFAHKLIFYPEANIAKAFGSKLFHSRNKFPKWSTTIKGIYNIEKSKIDKAVPKNKTRKHTLQLYMYVMRCKHMRAYWTRNVFFFLLRIRARDAGDKKIRFQI